MNATSAHNSTARISEKQAFAMTEPNLESTNTLLRVVVALLLRQGSEPLTTLRQQIGLLDELGLGPTEIGKIIGRPAKYVTKELAGLRKGKRKGSAS